MLQKSLKILSILSLVVIIIFICLSYKPYENKLINFIGEIALIPIILFVIVCFIFSLVKITGFNKDEKYYSIMIINGVTVCIMIIFTILQS